MTDKEEITKTLELIQDFEFAEHLNITKQPEQKMRIMLDAIKPEHLRSL